MVSAMLAATLAATAGARCPDGRAGHVAIYDPIRQQMVIFGGRAIVNNAYAVLLDTWSLSLGLSPAWTPMTPSGTPPQYSNDGAAVFDVAANLMIYIGGSLVGASGEVTSVTSEVHTLGLTPGAITWNTVSIAGSGPGARAGLTAVYDVLRDRTIIFGGDNDTDTWALTLTDASHGYWTQLSYTGTPPAARSEHTSTYDTEFDRLVISGGGPYLLKDTKVLTLPYTGSMVWSQPSVGYWNPQTSGTMVWDPVWRRNIVWGGYLNGGYTSDVIALANYQGDPTTYAYDREACGAAPATRYDHTAIYDAGNMRMVIFGGVQLPTNTFLNDTETFSLQYWNYSNTNWVTPVSANSCGGAAQPLTVGSESASLDFALAGSNPSSGTTRLSYSLPHTGAVHVEVVDVAGRRIAILADGSSEAGRHELSWDGLDSDGHRVSNGVYYAQMRFEGAAKRQRIVLLH
jgi:hypothetical protein